MVRPSGTRATGSPEARSAHRSLSRRADSQDHDIVGVGWGSTVYHVVTSGYFSAQAGHHRRTAHGERRRGNPGHRWRSGRRAAGPSIGGDIDYLQAPMVVTDAGVQNRAIARPAHSQDAGDGPPRQCAFGLGRSGDTGVGHLPRRLSQRERISNTSRVRAPSAISVACTSGRTVRPAPWSWRSARSPPAGMLCVAPRCGSVSAGAPPRRCLASGRSSGTHKYPGHR